MDMQFISFLHTNMTQVIEILPHVKQKYLFNIVNIIVVDVPATQGARASATLIFAMLNPINSVPTH